MKELALYPDRPTVKKQSFKGCKIVTVPSQNMSLREIITRFIRREALPVMHEGVYTTRMGDLEKLSKEDITVQMERVEELKANIAEGQKRVKEKKDAEYKAEIERKAVESVSTKTSKETGNVNSAATPAPSGS